MPTPADIAALRTLALVGPATAGKTTLAEALLWKAGAIGAPGSVERGTTVSDHDPLEKRAQRSLNSSLIHFRHRGVHAHVIDTPGAPDFLGQSLPALEAVETAAVVISATTGIEPMAGRMMQWAAQRERDRLIIVNKIDAQGVNLETLVAQIQAAYRTRMPAGQPAGRTGREGGGLLLQHGSRTAPPPTFHPWSRRIARWSSRWWKWTRLLSSVI